MAITKQDCLVLLAELKNQGIDTTKALKEAVANKDVSIDVIDFINKNRPFEVSQFYEKLRKSYNDKSSVLYKNIVKSDEVDNPKDLVVTLSSLGLQIVLFARTVQNQQAFLKQARYEELVSCLLHYSKTFDLVPSIKLLRLFKMDLKAFEYLNNREK